LNKLNAKKFARIRAVTSDAGNNGVDLRSTFAPLYASVAIVAEGWEIIDEPICRAGEPEIWSDEFRAKENEAMLASKIQFDITTEAVVKWKPKLVVMDGTLLLHFGLLPSKGSSEGYIKNFESTIKSAIGLLYVCYEHDIPIVGFIKRTRMRARTFTVKLVFLNRLIKLKRALALLENKSGFLRPE